MPTSRKWTVKRRPATHSSAAGPVGRPGKGQPDSFTSANPRLSSLFHSQGDGRPIPWLPEVQQKTDVIIGYYSGVFLLLCFFDHLFVATLFRGIYERYLRKAQNPFR